MSDENMIKVMQTLGLDYNPAINATKAFENRISSLNNQLSEMKILAMKGAKDLNNTFSSQLGSLGGQKSIVDQFGTPLKTVQTEAKKVGKGIADGFVSASSAAKQHSKTVEDVAKQYNVFGSEWQRRSSWFVSGSLFYGAMKGAKEAVQTISEVEIGMVEIGRVMEDSTFVFKDFRNELLQLGVDYGQTFDVVQDIALRWAQAGYGVQDSLDNTKYSLLALNTAELDATNATESLIGIMAQWQMTSADMPLLLDKINKTADDFTVTSQDLVDGLLRSSGAAKIMNLSIDETIALLTVMREASGRTGQEVGNALSSILSYMQRPSSINMLESLGINMFADAAKTQFRSVMEVFKDIGAQWSSSGEVFQDGFIKAADDTELFSEELAVALGMQDKYNLAKEEYNDLEKRDIAQSSAGIYRRNYFIGMIERLTTAQDVLNGITDAAGYSQSENARTMDTLEKKYESLKTSAQQLAVALGDAGLLDILKGLTDVATDATSGIAKLDDETRSLIITALELLVATKAIKSVGGMFGVDATLGVALKVLPGWTKLLVIIPAVAAAIGLYAHNLDSASDVTNGLKGKQEELTKAYNSQLEAAEANSKSLLEQAKKSETLASKLEELTKKENLNISEKAQMKSIVDQLNTSFPNLSLKIDEQTGKIIGNTAAIWDNIDALKTQAIAQGYQAKMTATASAYVDQESLLGQTQNELDFARSELSSLNSQKTKALQEIAKASEQLKIKAANEGWSTDTLGRALAGKANEYGISDMESQIIKYKGQVNTLTGLASQQGQLLSDLDSELSDWANKAIETAGSVSPIDDYVPNVGTPKSTGGTSSSYKNPGLETALKNLEHMKHINQISLENEIEYLNEVKGVHVNTADELMSLNEKIYDAEQSLMDETLRNSVNWINKKKNLNELSVEEEIAAWERVKNNQLDNIEAQNQATLNLYKLRNQLVQESYTQEENTIQHLKNIGLLSVEEQIEATKKLYETKAESLEDERDRVENLFGLYKELADEQIEAMSKSYNRRIEQINDEAEREVKSKERRIADIEEETETRIKAKERSIEAIEEESEVRKAIQNEIIAGINKELELLNLKENQYDHDQKMADLQEQLAYWQVRTSEDAREKVVDIIKQIDEAEHDRKVELEKQGLEEKKDVAEEEIRAIEDATDKKIRLIEEEMEAIEESADRKLERLEEEIEAIEEAADREVKAWEKSYSLVEEAFDEHTLNVIALARTMSKDAYDEWEKNYLIPLQRALEDGDSREVKRRTRDLDSSLDDLEEDTTNSKNAQIYRLANRILGYKKDYELSGDKSAADRAKSVYDDLEDLSPKVADMLNSLGYVSAKDYVAGLPKMHGGGKSLSYGAVEMMPGELTFPPDLSIKLESLIGALYQRPSGQGASSSLTDNRKEVNIETLLRIENNYMEDDIDQTSLARELQRQIKNLY